MNHADGRTGHRDDALARPPEEAGYLAHSGEQMYYVLHPPVGRRLGQVLLAGPFASERPHTYISWVRWARFLARFGFEALRFDYRGVSESTGRFEDMGLASWVEDVHACARVLRERGDGCPLVLHGHRMGALLAANAFEVGLGDALLLWSPPASGREMLRETLRRRLATDLALDSKAKRKTREEYIAELEAGKLVEVEGFLWSRKLWHSARDITLSLPEGESAYAVGGTESRPVKVVHLDRTAGALVDPYGLMVPVRRGRSQPRPLNPDLTEVFDANLKWIRQTVSGGGEER
jgi:hypothetical protein